MKSADLGLKVGWKPVSAYDLPQTAKIIETMRGQQLFMPVLLAVLCGLRRGEVCALRWRHVDFDTAQLSIVESIEQTRAGLRFKSPKSGKGRTVALSATVIEELRAHRAKRAQALLLLGMRLSDEDFVVGLSAKTGSSPAAVPPPTRLLMVSIRRSPVSGWDIAGLASLWIFTVTSFPGCWKMPLKPLIRP